MLMEPGGLRRRGVAQLTAPRFGPDSAGRIQVEPKKHTLSRIKRSPDALLLAFYDNAPSDLSSLHGLAF
jgi:hypothetical protein